MSATKPATDVPIVTSLGQDQAATIASVLQPTLVELIDLALTGKQLHWAIVGPRFKPIHEHLDVLVAEHHEYADMVAEYLSTIGIVPDGRSVRVAADASMDPVEAEFLHDEVVVDDMVERLTSLATDVRGRIPIAATADPAAEDLLIELQRVLDKQLWMTSAMR